MSFYIPQHEKKEKNKTTTWLSKRKKVARKPKRIRLITFGSLKNDLNKLRIIPGSGV